MGLFNELFKKEKRNVINNSSKSNPSAEDNLIGTINTCPSCNVKLVTIPSRKKKCQNCGEFIYIRTRPHDNKKVLVTEKEKDIIEKQWQQHFQDIEDKKTLEDLEFIKAKKELSKQFGKEVSINDIKWYVYNQRTLEFASKRQWGLYRCNVLDMANLLIRENKHKQALVTLYEVCYLDLNGCRNVPEYLSDKDIDSYGIKDFDIGLSFLIPDIVSRIENEIEILKITDEGAKRLFFERIDKIKPRKNMPLSSEDVWKKVIERISQNQKLQKIDPNDTDNTFKEINELIRKKEFSDAITLINEFKSLFYSKKQNFPDVGKIKKRLIELLNSKEEQIANAAESLILTIAKKGIDINDVLEIVVKKIKNNMSDYIESNMIGELALINLKWVKPMIPELIKNLKDYPEWNGRRFSAFNLGKIATKEPDFVKESIPIMINYIKKPYEVTKRDPITVKSDKYSVSIDLSSEKILGVDQTQWLRDAYIDSIEMIAEGDKTLVLQYKSLFEEIAKKDKSEYSRKKAQKVLDVLNSVQKFCLL